MLAAEKYAYLEEMESVMEPVREPQWKEQPSHRERTKAAPVPKPRTLSKVVTLAMVFICFATACFAVFRYALIAESHARILELQSSLEKENVQQEKLKVELAGSEDLNNIEFAAAADLGMQYPEEGQVMYVDIPEPDKNTEQADANAAGQTHESIWSRLLGNSN
jgi:cell division protein FtsL